jgi:hypothetical protein
MPILRLEGGGDARKPLRRCRGTLDTTWRAVPGTRTGCTAYRTQRVGFFYRLAFFKNKLTPNNRAGTIFRFYN